MKRLMVSTSVAALAFVPDMALAQQAAAKADTGLSEIIVTAQRKTESAQKAALAISVVTSEALQNAGVSNATGLSAVVPSLSVANGGASTTSYFIRGVGNFTFNAYSDPAVAYNYDGIYLGRPTSTGTAFFDLERIEVLKGPQGTLYGRNATGGAINVLPAKPVIGQNSASVSAGFGNYGAWDVDAAVNLALGEHSAVRVAGKLIRQDGFNRDGTDDQNGKAVRVQFLTKPSADISLRLSGDYSHQGGNGSGSTIDGVMAFAPGAPASATAPANYVYVPSGLAPRSGLLSPATQAYISRQVIGGSFNFAGPFDVAPRLDDTNWGVMGEANANTAIGKLTIQSAYRASILHDRLNGPTFRGGIVNEKDSQFSLEARLAGKQIGPVEWLAGGYYYSETVNGGAAYNQYVVLSNQQYDVNTRSLAGFGRATLHVSDAFRLVAAGRYTHDRKRMDGLATSLLNVCANAAPPAGPGCFGGPSLPTAFTLAQVAQAIPAAQLPFGFPQAPGPANATPFGNAGNVLFYLPAPVNQTLVTNRFTYRLAAEYDVGPRSLAYVSYETGYRSGGFSLAIGRETYNPEYIYALTAGIKNRLFNNKVQFNVELFHWTYKNQQVSHFGLDGLGLNAYFTQNIGRSTIQGADVDAQVKIDRLGTVYTTVQYLDSKLDAFTYQTPRGPAYLPPATGCGVAPGSDGGGNPVYTVNCAGKPGYNSPRWSIDFGARQGFDIGALRVTVSADGRYRASRIIGFDDLPQQIAGADVIADGAIAVGSPDGRWTMTGWIHNIGNTLSPTVTQFNSSTGGTLSTVYAPPRTYGLRAAVRF